MTGATSKERWTEREGGMTRHESKREMEKEKENRGGDGIKMGHT